MTGMGSRGDSKISSFERRLWILTLETLRRWDVLVPFQWVTRNVPASTPEIIRFFVPADHPDRERIVAWIEHETLDMIHPSVALEEGITIPPSRVEVRTEFWTDLDPYLERENLEKVCRDRDDLIEQIQVTVRHEIGHHLGLSEEDLERLGLA